jgi:hypothetical protein
MVRKDVLVLGKRVVDFVTHLPNPIEQIRHHYREHEDHKEGQAEDGS